MVHLLHDLRYSARRLRTRPRMLTAGLLLLTIATGGTTAIFSIIDAVLLRPLSLDREDELAAVHLVRPDTERGPAPLPFLLELQDGAQSLSSLAAWFQWSANLTGEAAAERLQGMRVTENYFEVLGSRTALGRTFTAADRGGPAAVVISHGFWQRRFGGSRHAIGQTIRLNDEVFTIAGVLHAEYPLQLRDTDVIAPWRADTDARRTNPALGFLRVVARLRAGFSPRAAADEVDALLADYRRRYPAAATGAQRARLVPLREDLTGTSRRMLSMLAGALAVVTLVSILNLSNLLLADGTSRRQEFAIRRAMGATTGRAGAQLATEALLMAAMGVALGSATAAVSVAVIAAGAGTALPAFLDVSLTWRSLAFAAGMSAFVTLASSIALAPLLASRHADAGGARTVTPRTRRIKAAIVCAQVGLAVVLLVACGLLLRSFFAVLRVNPGFSAERVLTLRLSLPRPAYPTTSAVARFYDSLGGRLAVLPGVETVAAANVVPMNGWLATVSFRPPGLDAATAWPEAHYRMVSSGYAAAMGIPLLSGRPLSDNDRAGAAPVVLISQGMAAAYWGARNPVGARIQIRDNGTETREVEIAGVVGDVKHLGLEADSPHEVYVPIAQVPDQTSVWLANNMYWIVKTRGEPLAMSNAVKEQVAAVDRGVATSFVRSMSQWLDRPLQARRFYLRMMLILALTAVLLAIAGIYAVVAETVATRRRELALRAALGAAERQLQWTILRDGLLAVAAGLVLGLALSLSVARLLAAFLFGIDATDVMTFSVVCLVAAGMGALAVYIPARGAMRIDPVLALRE